MAAPRGRPSVNLPSISRVSGLLVGLGLALVALVGARVPAGTGQVPASASLKAEPSVLLGVSPVGRELLGSERLVPGTSVSGRVRVSNLTGGPLVVLPRVRSLDGTSADALRIDLPAKMRLRPFENRRLRVRISAPAGRADDVEGRTFHLSLRFRTPKAGR
jgi:hypothetical protein